MTSLNPYCCTDPQCHRANLSLRSDGLYCPNGHIFPFFEGTDVPIFASEPLNTNEYSITNAAEIHDNALRWVFSTFGADEPCLRRRLVSRLRLVKGQKVLITGAGAGNDLPYVAESLHGVGEIYVQDIAKEMLLAGVARHHEQLSSAELTLHFSVSDASNLPFHDGFFDAAYHFGGINLFPNIAKGIQEMNRVVRPGGTVVVGDEGLAPWLLDTEYGNMLINNNPLYACALPLTALPKTVRAVNVSWELGNCFYVIDFQASNQPLVVNMDIPHKGKRGGTIRSRYFGKLEGVDPSLRDQIYAEAERQGVSRVEFIEAALRGALPPEQKDGK